MSEKPPLMICIHHVTLSNKHALSSNMPTLLRLLKTTQVALHLAVADVHKHGVLVLHFAHFNLSIP